MINREKLFYFDCEWVPVTENLMNLKLDYPLLEEAFTHQCEKWDAEFIRNGAIKKKGEGLWWEEKAHFYPEFCKIICVSYGFFNKGEFIVKSLYGDNEKKLLTSIPDLFGKVEKLGFTLCGYAIKRFDMPWLSKRLMANGIQPPKILCMYGKKPWEIEVFDLPEVWGQGNMQESFTPFELACAAVGMKSSKGDLSGSKVKEAYWNGQLERIKTYCELDVTKTMELATKLIELLP
ncbi:MAG: hypothetical protein PHF86_01735 [Candidatus Nanoarchaeia archaeon]|nr:hypothetical protein [Candidatus Nanoarchaeia archaeon]